MPTDTVDTELVLLVNTIELTLDELRRAVREGAVFVAVDCTVQLQEQVGTLAVLFPEED